MKTYLKERQEGFSLIELTISLVIISLVAAAFAPVITKKLSRSSIIVGGGSVSGITDQCEDKYGSYCKLCSETYCIQCAKSCPSGQYVKSRECNTCNSCSDFDANCSICSQGGCTKCNSSDYYLLNGKCTACPSGKACDGSIIKDQESCLDGYYCDSSGQHLCSSKFSNCLVCKKDGSRCTQCEAYYATSSSSNGCVKCPTGCYECAQDGKYCLRCVNDRYLDNNGTCQNFCATKVQYCRACKDDGSCYSCTKGYFSNSSGSKCLECNITNCVLCKNNANKASCNYCNAGYYVNSSGTCSPATNYGEKCVAADKEKCLSCASGYVLDEKNKCVVDNSNEFRCSSPDFMRIGKLCFTRRNMGDSAALPVRVSGVVVVRVDGMTCQSNYLSCCWQGDCESSSNYSACKRSACNYKAAFKVCSSLDIDGGGWRLPTEEEYLKLAYHSAGLGENGAMMAGDGTTYKGGTCFGAILDNSCHLEWYLHNMGENPVGSYYLLFENWSGTIMMRYDYGNRKLAASIRCVKDME